jgi:hypothetical protein
MDITKVELFNISVFETNENLFDVKLFGIPLKYIIVAGIIYQLMVKK